jgi:hypothetical protein
MDVIATKASAMHHLFRLTSFWRLLVLVPIGAAWLALSGCTQVQVAPDVRGEYEFGALQVFVDSDFMRAYEASKRGMKDIGLFQTGDDRKVIEAELNGRDSVDTKVTVKVREIGYNRVSLKIRYGLKPDLPAAQKLFTAIQKHL